MGNWFSTYEDAADAFDLNVIDQYGRSRPVKARPSDTVSIVKKKCGGDYWSNLVFKRQSLQDTKTMADYGIGQGASVTLESDGPPKC